MGISREKENNLIKGPWSQTHGETGLVGFFSFHQCQVDFIFRAVMILKIKGRGVSKAPTGTWGRAPSAAQLLLPDQLKLFRADYRRFYKLTNIFKCNILLCIATLIHWLTNILHFAAFGSGGSILCHGQWWRGKGNPWESCFTLPVRGDWPW